MMLQMNITFVNITFVCASQHYTCDAHLLLLIFRHRHAMNYDSASRRAQALGPATAAAPRAPRLHARACVGCWVAGHHALHVALVD
jgi:hypothetical protein